ncbi:MAG: hypothetical protein KDC46_05880 [Thermoleophilia bacterium]|nr:hypothetical protein [Thermoleophilia bacterium]
MANPAARRRLASVMAVTCAAAALIGATRSTTSPAAGADPASARATITLKPGTIRARDIASRQILPRHFGLRTMNRLIGYGPARTRPRATRATAGWLYFASDVDGGALFRSNGRSWDQLTPGRLGKIARNSLDSSRIKPKGITASRLDDRAVTSRSMSMDAWRAISTSGLLAARPSAGSRPAGSFYFATDMLGGTLYQSDGYVWNRVSSLGAEANISANSVTSSMLAPASVTSAELATNAVTSSELAAGSVGSAEIADGSVTLAKIAAAVWSDRLASGTVVARPAASAANANSLYFASDDAGGTLARSDGASWTTVGRSRSPRTVDFMFGQWTNQPAALTEYFGANRSTMAIDLSTQTQVRLSTVLYGAGFTNAKLCGQYSVDFGSTWLNFDGSAGTSCATGVVQVALNSTGLKVSGWQDLPATARDENALVRLVGQSGNGGSDPRFGSTVLELR